jgi:DNA polymerase-3 subunit delta
LATWINRRAREAYAKGVEPQAVAELLDLVGNRLEALDNELGKLAVYVGARERITAADVEALVGMHREETVFRVTDAMSAGNAAGALQAWQHALATDRAAPDRAIGGLAWAIRRLLEAKQAVAAGVPPESLAGRFRQNTDALVRRLNSTTAERLEAQLADLHHADLDIKTGLGDVETAVEAFIVKHTVPRKEPARTPVGGNQA